MRGRSSAAWMTLLVGVFILSLGPLSRAQDEDRAQDGPTWTASLELEPSEVKLGEPLKLTITLKGDNSSGSGPEYGLPASLELGPFVELDRQELPSGASGQTVFVLKLASFEELGELEIPALQLVARAEGSRAEPIDLPAVQIKVLSLLEGVTDPSPRDLAGPVVIQVADYRAVVFFCLLGLWGLLALVLRQTPQSVSSKAKLLELPPPRMAHEIALGRLDKIVADDLLRQGLAHRYFVRISDTVREYLGNRYAFFALDLTSRELLEELRDRVTPGLEQESLEHLLSDADLVKFARHKPSDGMCSEAINGAHALVEATRIREVKPDENEGTTP